MSHKKKRVKKQLKRGKKNKDTKVPSSKLQSIQLVAIGLLAGSCFLFTGWEEQNSPYQTIAQEMSENHYLPVALPVIEHAGYTVAYDARTKNPSWVYEHLTPESLEKNVKAKGHKFQDDPYVASSLQASLGDFKRSGYRKGMLCSAENHRTSYDEVDQTFYLSNVTPQDPWFAKGIWNDLEKLVRNIAYESQHLYVVSGSLFLPGVCEDGTRYVQYEVIGENNVGVPTHYYKALLIENFEGELEMKGYLLRNEAVSSDFSIDEFEISVQELEQLSGLIFFNHLDPDVANYLKNQ